MIQSLKIKNVALARSVDIDFCSGFNVLLGETGAGKSIILDALNFALGDKADKELITSGENQMRVDAVFVDYSNNVKTELESLGIDDEGMLVISRLLNIDGKSEIKINGNSVTLSMLKSLSKYLADSYSQHENLILLKPKNHLAILDSFDEGKQLSDKEQLKNIVSQIRQIDNQLKTLGGSGENRERMIELIKFQVEEIEKEKPTKQKEDEIAQTLSVFNNSEKIANGLSVATEMLDGGEYSALASVKKALRNLSSISSYSPQFASLHERLSSLMYELDDIAAILRDEKRNTRFDPKEYQLLDAKMDRYKMLKKKYGGSIENVLAFLEKSKVDLENLVNAEQKILDLEKQKQSLNTKGNSIATHLSQIRKNIAKVMETEIKIELGFLGMKNANFVVNFGQKDFDENGFDDVEFLFSANAGMEVKPLSKIISGGEMSRFSLAIKNIVKEKGACMVFDEIDSGISGEIGREVGQRIARLSKDNQVICISHSPQVCAMADGFFLVTKQTTDQKTTSFVERLQGEQISNALAKMASGKDLTTISIAHAVELLDRARKYKNTL